MRSRTGGIGRPGGEGVSTRPPRRSVGHDAVEGRRGRSGRARPGRAPRPRPRARRRRGRRGRRPRRRGRALSSRSRISDETMPSSESRACARARGPRARRRGRPGRAGRPRPCSRPRRAGAGPAAARRRAEEHLARRTRCPAVGEATTRPPFSGESLARRRALTVPARELVTVSSTRPFSATTTRTGTGAVSEGGQPKQDAQGQSGRRERPGGATGDGQS